MFFMLLQPGGVLEEVEAYTRGGAKTIVQFIDTCVMGVIQAVKGSAAQARMKLNIQNENSEAHASNISSRVQGFMTIFEISVVFFNSAHRSRRGDVVNRIKCFVYCAARSLGKRSSESARVRTNVLNIIIR